MLYFAIGVLVIISLLIVRHILRVRTAGKKMKKVENAALQMRIATFARLSKRYKSQYGSQAQVLATAITNELFSDKSPDDSPAKIFIETRKNVVEQELIDLKDDEDLLNMVHVTLSQEIVIRYAYGATAKEIEETLNKLKRYGLLVPIKGITTDKFVDIANKFYSNNISE